MLLGVLGSECTRLHSVYHTFSIGFKSDDCDGYSNRNYFLCLQARCYRSIQLIIMLPILQRRQEELYQAICRRLHADQLYAMRTVRSIDALTQKNLKKLGRQDSRSSQLGATTIRVTLLFTDESQFTLQTDSQ